MIKIEKTSKTDPLNQIHRQVVEKFISDKLRIFAGRDTGSPIIETVGGKERTTDWRWFINHFFFIERGYYDKNVEYISLIQNHGTGERELAFAHINLSKKWRVLSCDTPRWGENLLIDVECSEAAVIRSMISFLFDDGYITADLESFAEDSEEESANEHSPIPPVGK